MSRTHKTKGTHRLRSGVVVTYRAFRGSDAKECSGILLRNFKPLIERMGQETWNREIGEVYSESNIGSVATERDYYVAIIDDKLVGVIGFCPFSDRIMEVSNLSVDPIVQGKGIGKLLVALGLLTKIKEGVEKFYAYCGTESRALFTKFGFTECEDPRPDLGIAEGFVPLETDANDLLVHRTTELLGRFVE